MNNISSSLPQPLPPSISSLLPAAGQGQGPGSFADALNELNPSPLSSQSVTGGDTTSRKIEKVGQDFEAIFFSMMLKEMRNSISIDEEGGLFAGEGSDTYGGLFDTFLGQHLASSNQLGIAQSIQSYLKNQLS